MKKPPEVILKNPLSQESPMSSNVIGEPMKPEFSIHDYATLSRALASKYNELIKTMRATKKAQDAGKRTRNQLSSLAMEAGEYKMLHERIGKYMKDVKEQAERSDAHNEAAVKIIERIKCEHEFGVTEPSSRPSYDTECCNKCERSARELGIEVKHV